MAIPDNSTNATQISSRPQPMRRLWNAMKENPAPTFSIGGAILSLIALVLNAYMSWSVADATFNRSIALEIIKHKGQLCEVNERLTFLIDAKVVTDESTRTAVKTAPKCPK